MTAIRKLVFGIIGIAVIGLAAFLVWWFAIKSDPKPRLNASDLDKGLTGQTSTTSGAGGGGLDGTWTLASADSTVQYRIKESIAGALESEAVGVSRAATGDLSINGGAVETATFSVQVSTLKSDQSFRDTQMNRLMDTGKFADATFKLTKPITLGSVPADGVTAKFTATGDLTLHGTTKSVTFPVDAKKEGARIGVLGNIPVTFADYTIENPSNAVTKVGTDGLLEFVLFFDQK
ncbi:MAG: YceI family protein [Acidimicrobiia bacterium]